jgi:hypothetical protein
LFERSVRPFGPTLAFVRLAGFIRRVWADVQGQTCFVRLAANGALKLARSFVERQGNDFRSD